MGNKRGEKFVLKAMKVREQFERELTGRGWTCGDDGGWAKPSAEDALDADVAAWLAGCGAPECEAAFREAMVETLGDVAFLVSTRADLSEMGLSEPQVDTLWEHVADEGH